MEFDLSAYFTVVVDIIITRDFHIIIDLKVLSDFLFSFKNLATDHSINNFFIINKFVIEHIIARPNFDFILLELDLS